MKQTYQLWKLKMKEHILLIAKLHSSTNNSFFLASNTNSSFFLAFLGGFSFTGEGDLCSSNRCWTWRFPLNQNRQSNWRVPASCSSSSATLQPSLAPLGNLANQTGESHASWNRQWHWRDQCHVSQPARSRQWLLQFTCFLRQKQHHAGNTSKRDPFRKYVSKWTPCWKICPK